MSLIKLNLLLEYQNLPDSNLGFRLLYGHYRMIYFQIGNNIRDSSQGES